MSALKTPDKCAITVQPGHIVVNSSFNDANLLDNLKKHFNRVKSVNLGDYDFLLPNNRIVYVSEKKLLTDMDTSKLKSLNNPLVIADRNKLTSDVFSKLQNILYASNITLFPVGHPGELPLLLYQISSCYDHNSPSTDFRPNRQNSANIQQEVLLSVPGLGRVKADSLLKKFGSVQKVAFASEAELTQVVGTSCASQIYSFFNGVVNQ